MSGSARQTWLYFEAPGAFAAVSSTARSVFTCLGIETGLGYSCALATQSCWPQANTALLTRGHPDIADNCQALQPKRTAPTG